MCVRMSGCTDRTLLGVQCAHHITSNKSSPKSFGKRASLPLRRRMHSSAACASCTMRNVTEQLRYRSVMEPLRGITEALRSGYGTLQSVTEPLRKMSILPTTK